MHENSLLFSRNSFKKNVRPIIFALFFFAIVAFAFVLHLPRDEKGGMLMSSSTPWEIKQASSSFVNITSNIEADSFFSGNGTSGLTWDSPYSFKNLNFNALSKDIIISIYNTTRHVLIDSCTFIKESNDTDVGRVAILVVNSSNIRISRVTVVGFSEVAIHVMNSTNMTVSGSTIESNNWGISLDGFNDNCSILNNFFTNNTRALNSRQNSHVFVEGNEFRDNFLAFNLKSDNYINITKNVFADCISGIVFQSSVYSSSQDNFVWNNYFVNDVYPGSDEPSMDNHWDNGSWGNYWSNYENAHPDAENDGRVWNESYTVSYYFGTVYDNFPLVFCSFPYVDFQVNGSDVKVNQSIWMKYSGIDDLGGNVSASWMIDGKVGGLGLELTVTFDTPGKHEIQLNITDDDGDMRFTRKYIDVLPETNNNVLAVGLGDVYLLIIGLIAITVSMMIDRYLRKYSIR
ncbi:MAG: right-handed parallel beta-helix repeat-containing protein [Promethearchaeota archaeon]